MLHFCRSIHTLNLSNNFIRSMIELQGLLQANGRLQRLRVAGNPICHINKCVPVPLSCKHGQIPARLVARVRWAVWLSVGALVLGSN